MSDSSTIKFKLFIMMILEIAIWGAWEIKIFSYMGMLGFTPGQQGWVGSVFGIASLVGIFFSNQFAERQFSWERRWVLPRLFDCRGRRARDYS